MKYPYDITVFYALHESKQPVPDFPAQTLSRARIQVIPLHEDDPYHPRAQALAKIPEAEGEYIILLDAGDIFSRRFLKQMLAFAKKTSSSFVMSSQRGQDIHRSTEFYPLRPCKKKLLLDANENPLVFPTCLHALLFPAQELKDALAKTNGLPEQEKQILLHLLHQNPKFGYLGNCHIEYIQPRECDHQYDIRSLTREWYYEPFEQFLLPLLEKEQQLHGTVPLFLQHLALYMIDIRFNSNIDNRNKYILTRDEIPAYTELVSSILQYVSVEAILDFEVHTSNASRSFKLTILRMKKRDWSWYPELEFTEDSIRLTCDGVEFHTLEEMDLAIHLIDYREGCLEIDASYRDYLREDQVELYARFGSGIYRPVYNRRYSMTKYFGTSFIRKKTFHISIPVDAEAGGPMGKGGNSPKCLLSFYLRPHTASEQAQNPSAGSRVSGSERLSAGESVPEYRLKLSYPSHTSRFARALYNGYWRFGRYVAVHNDKGIYVRLSNPLFVVRKELFLWGEMLLKKVGRKYLPLKIVNFTLRPWFSRQRIWLFMDKIYKGGDSSEYIYKYAAAQDDGIRKYYLLDKTSADYQRLIKEGYRPLRRGSVWHRLIFLNANLVIASNSTVFAFNSYSTTTSRSIRGDIHFDVACVQHGMSVQKIAIAQQRLRDNTKLYFCASKYEIENLSKPPYDYEGYDALKLTGVPRYDGLKSRAEKIILISPTWRMNSALPPTKGESVARAYNPHFKETNYYKVYNSLINDPRLLAAADQYGYRIQYVLHPIISPQEKDFKRNKHVEIIPSIGDMSYEKLFCEAALMVTDFSGVQFDFAYMRKPVIYLHHHDIPQHYEEGSFFYETMGFGEICRTNDVLIDVLCDYMKNDCRMPDQYRQRADDFFAFSDNNNCARIYPIMLEHEMSHAARP
ncbi:MAG: CDP-glycerol glycerophosphotransferase family protein [Clostridiales bacterium]|nr:CDP-glycerol glycerophosphotransferase family protein [Clostridiales bacterium]